jgi:hypothetical protein
MIHILLKEGSGIKPGTVHPEAAISWLNNPACTYPCQRFATPSRVVDA